MDVEFEGVAQVALRRLDERGAVHSPGEQDDVRQSSHPIGGGRDKLGGRAGRSGVAW